MTKSFRLFALTFLAIVIGWQLAVHPSRAKDFAPKTDNHIVCLELRTGKLVWEYKRRTMSDAHFEVTQAGVIAYPNYNGHDRGDPIYLNWETGKSMEPFPESDETVLAKSATFATKQIQLANGWSLSGFSPGNTKTLQFKDANGEATWEVKTDSYPHQVAAWKNFVFYAFSYLSDEGILYAYQAGKDKPTWTVDLNEIVKGRSEPLTRMIFQVIDDRLYLEANEHIFCLDPETGKLHWHRNLAKDLDLKFEGDFFGGGLNLAVFAKSEDVLVISFERRVVALDLETGKVLWHLQPGTFPHCPFPVAYKDRVILTTGAEIPVVMDGRTSHNEKDSTGRPQIPKE